LNIRIALTAVVALVALPAVAQETYVIESTHSQPQWIARHIGFSNQHGNFGKATGKILLDRAAKKGSIDVSIDAASIRT
jgi:polyisoprenoid-binding protein YceI